MDLPQRPRRWWTSRLPIWVRVSLVVGLVLAGVLLSTMLLAGTGVGERSGSGSGHGAGTGMEMDDDGEATTPRPTTGPGATTPAATTARAATMAPTDHRNRSGRR